MKKLLAFTVLVAFLVLSGLIIEVIMNTAFDKWCLYDPWFLLFKNSSIYIIIFFETFSLLFIQHRLVLPPALQDYKRTITFSLYFSLLCAFILFFYASWSFGNYAAGACANPAVNTNYYKHPGQEKFLK